MFLNGSVEALRVEGSCVQGRSEAVLDFGTVLSDGARALEFYTTTNDMRP